MFTADRRLQAPLKWNFRKMNKTSRYIAMHRRLSALDKSHHRHWRRQAPVGANGSTGANGGDERQWRLSLF